MRAYFGHHKCASTWVWQLMQRVSREIGLSHYSVYDEQTPLAHAPLVAIGTNGHGAERAKGAFERAQVRERAEQAGADFVSCMTADRQQVDALGATRAFHVIRDPRDIIVSGYFSHRNARPADHPGADAWGLPHIAEHRERLLSVSKEEGLVLEMDFAHRELVDLAEWDYERPEILELRLEELSAKPYDGFVRIFQHLELLPEDEPNGGRDVLSVWLRRTLNRLSSRRGLAGLRRPMPATGEIVLGAVYWNRFESNAKGRRAGAEDTKSHYRKGVAGDWVNHFTPPVSKAFEERFNGLPQQLGYA
jgi:hypothetical protein